MISVEVESSIDEQFRLNQSLEDQNDSILRTSVLSIDKGVSASGICHFSIEACTFAYECGEMAIEIEIFDFVQEIGFYKNSRDAIVERGEVIPLDAYQPDILQFVGDWLEVKLPMTVWVWSNIIS